MRVLVVFLLVAAAAAAPPLQEFIMGGLSSDGRAQQQRYDMIGQRTSVKDCLSEGDFSNDISAQIKKIIAGHEDGTTDPSKLLGQVQGILEKKGLDSMTMLKCVAEKEGFICEVTKLFLHLNINKFTPEMLKMATGTEVEARIEDGVQKCGAEEGLDLPKFVLCVMKLCMPEDEVVISPVSPNT